MDLNNIDFGFETGNEEFTNSFTVKKINDNANAGDVIDGKPYLNIYTNEDKNYDSIRVRIIDNGETYQHYINIPKIDELGFIKNIHSENNFLNPCYDFIASIYKLLYNSGCDNFIRKVNIRTVVNFINTKDNISVRVDNCRNDLRYKKISVIGFIGD